MDDAEAIRVLPLTSLRYIPAHRDSTAWASLAAPGPIERDAKGLALPPDHLLAGYAPDVDGYLVSGALHVRTMKEKLAASGFDLGAARRILDFGCGIARMIRHLPDHNTSAEMWGVDISATHIEWCNRYLRPPFHFATTTTLPHLPFPDGYFDLVYAGSVFTHIDELPDAWILEMRRILSPSGRAYVTLSDEGLIHILDTDPEYMNHWLAEHLHASPVYQENKDTFGMLVIHRGINSQVFYRADYFARMIWPSFTVHGRYPGEHGFQTAYVLTPAATR